MAVPVATTVGTGTITSTNPLVITLTSAVPAGNSISLRITNRTNRAVSSITDTAGNTYVERVDQSGTGVGGVCIADCLNPAALASGNTITITFNGSATAYAVAQELGATCTYVSGSAAAAGGNTANPSIATGVSVPADSLAVGVLTWGATTNAGVQSGWVGVAEASYGTRRFEAHNADVTSPGVQTFAPTGLGTSNDYNIAVAAYSSPAGGGGQTVEPALYTNTQDFFAATVTPGAVTVSPTLYTNGQTFYAATVTPGAVTIAPSLYTNDQAFYGAVVSQAGGAQTVAPNLYTNAQAFYGTTVSSGAVTIAPVLLVNAQQFYAATVVTAGGTQVIQPSLFANENTFFGASVSGGQGQRGGFMPRQVIIYYEEEPEKEEPKRKPKRKARKVRITQPVVEAAIEASPLWAQALVSPASISERLPSRLVLPSTDTTSSPTTAEIVDALILIIVQQAQAMLDDEDDILMLLLAA